MKNTFYLILIVIFFSCNQTKGDLENSIFTVDEKLIAMNILQEFDNALIVETGEENIEDAYLSYSNRLQESNSITDFFNNQKLNKEQCLKIIDKYKKTNFFKEVWTINYGYSRSDMKDTVAVFLDINPLGKYLNYLGELSVDKPILKKYIIAIKECNCIPPSIIAGFPNIIDEFDLNKKNERLIIAIHYLTILSVKQKKQAVNKQ